MNFVINGIVDSNNINNVNIIDNIDIFNLVDVYKNIFANNNVNNIENFFHSTFDISNVDVSFTNLNIKKINANNKYIYCISFSYIICINFVFNNQLQQFKVTDICSKSFIYEDLDINYFDLYPINLDVINLEGKLGFCVNFIIVRKIISNSTNTLFSNLANNNKTPMDNNSTFISKEFAYIDVSEEFI